MFVCKWEREREEKSFSVVMQSLKTCSRKTSVENTGDSLLTIYKKAGFINRTTIYHVELLK